MKRWLTRPCGRPSALGRAATKPWLGLLIALAISFFPFLAQTAETPKRNLLFIGQAKGYQHEATFFRSKKKRPSELMPRVHRVISLLKRWLMGTHQGAVSHKHLDYYLDEFTFRFNRRNSRSRGKLFLRLAEQAVAVGPSPYKSMVKCFAKTDGADHNM